MWRWIALVLVLVPVAADAAAFFAGDRVHLPADITYRDDLYVAGGDLRISATIEGDLVIAGGQLVLEGPVSGDVIVAGGSVRIAGAVGGSVRAAAGTLQIEGPIGEDLVASAGQVTLASGVTVGRDVVAQVGTLTLGADVGRRVLVRSGEATISGDVEGDVRAEVGSLQVGAVRIGGTLLHEPDGAVEVDPGAQIAGGVVALPPAVEEPQEGEGFGVVGWLRLLVGLWALGALFVLIAPRWSENAARAEFERPGLAALLGLALLLGVPAAALLVLLLGLFIGGWWIAPLLFFAWAIAVALALPTSALALGRSLAGRIRREHLPWPLVLLAGVLLLGVLLAIPVVGALVALIAAVFGLGALALGSRGRRAPAPPPG